LLNSLYGSEEEEEESTVGTTVTAEEKTEENEEEKQPSIPSLLDLAARVTGKHYSCASLESQQEPPLDERMLEKVIYILKMWF